MFAKKRALLHELFAQRCLDGYRGGLGAGRRHQWSADTSPPEPRRAQRRPGLRIGLDSQRNVERRRHKTRP